MSEDLQYSFKNFKPRPHQLDALNFALSRPDGRGIISCATGTGKAMMKLMMGIFLIKKLNRLDKYIIVAPPKAKISIEGDAKQYTNVNLVYIDDLKSFIDFLRSSDKMAIMTYEIKKKLSYTKNGSLFLLPKVEEEISKYRIGYAFDEIHKLKNNKSIVYNFFNLLTKDCVLKFGFTGTILMSSLFDIFFIIDFISPNWLSSYYSFTRNYVVFREMRIGMKKINVPAYFKNLDELKTRIEPLLFSYFPKSNINFEEHRCQMSQETKEQYLLLAMGLVQDPDEEQDEDEDFNILSHSSRMVRLQYCVDDDLNKQNLLLEQINNCSKTGAIVYASYHKTLDTLRGLFNENHLSFQEIHGKMNEKSVKSSLEWFTKDPENKVLLISDAGSASLNIQACNNLILYNNTYAIGNFQQLLGRIVRMNSVHDVFNVKQIIVEDTIDQYKSDYMVSNKEVYTELFGTQIKLPSNQGSQSFNSYLLQQLRNKYLWNPKNLKSKNTVKNKNSNQEVKSFWSPGQK